jgi:hypothetical protein
MRTQLFYFVQGNKIYVIIYHLESTGHPNHNVIALELLNTPAPKLDALAVGVLDNHCT